MTSPAFTQVTFRGRNDDGSESGATWKDVQGNDWIQDTDLKFRVRFRIDETNVRAWTNITWNLYYQLNAGGYNAVTASTPVKFALSDNFTDGDDCTDQLTGGSGTFVANNNGMKESTGGATNSGTAGYLFELEFCLILDGAQLFDNDTINLRIYNGSAAIAAYTDTPVITVNLLSQNIDETVSVVKYKGISSLNQVSVQDNNLFEKFKGINSLENVLGYETATGLQNIRILSIIGSWVVEETLWDPIGGGEGGTGTLSVSTPVSYRVFQRNGSNQGNIIISGTYTGTPGPIEASFNGGSWSQICGTPTGGVFSGTLSNQTAGQGTLSVRWIGNGGNTVNVALVGIGDIFIIAGQSNAVGYSSGNQSYSHATLKACMFGNDYNWKELVDPVDNPINQVDSVSDDTPEGYGGSCWPPVATAYLADQGVPCAFVPCALASTSIDQWLPGADHQNRTTLYGSMVYRALQTGAKVVLWWQGETEVLNGIEAGYNEDLDTLANAIYEDLGIPLMACRLQNMEFVYGGYDETALNAEINEAIGDNSHVLAGPDFHLVNFNDVGNVHYNSAYAVDVVGPAWWTALQTAFGW